MNKTELITKSNSFNNDTNKLNFNINSFSNLKSDFTDFKKSWNTSNGKEVCKDMDKNLQDMENYLNEMKRIVEEIKSEYIHVHIDKLTTDIITNIEE